MNIQTLYNPQFTAGMTMLLVGAASFLTTLPAAAHPSSENTAPFQMAQSSPAIIGSWRLTNMTAPGSPMPMLPAAEKPLTAEFQGDRLSGSGGCNRFMGGFQTEDNQLKIGPLASTFMACEQGIMTQESNYLKALQGAQRYEVTPQGLTIYYQIEQGEGVLRYVAQESAQQEPQQSTPQQSQQNTPQQPQQNAPQGSQPVRALW